MPSMWELVIILVIVALLFGTKKLKTIGGDLGGAIKGFRNAMKEEGAAEPLEENKPDAGSVIEGEVEKNSSGGNQA